MTEWTVVGVIVALIGLIASIVTPMLKLNTSITKLTCAVETFQKNLDELIEKNSDSHTRLWQHNCRQDDTLNDHETRICVIEKSRCE
ncbi:hypothetical protein IZU99_03125 [Oscillospiraceae bacterium CM]|nr:hypothetical protein IZU99_03125 [Oscillospiraceae bacterium CM]